MSSFTSIEKQSKRALKSMADYAGLDESLVENIVQYAKCLPREGSSDIDEHIFTSQMIRHFNLTHADMIGYIFRSLQHEIGKDVQLSNFCKCICTFLTNKLNVRSEFVFHVYDINRKGGLSYRELYTLVKSNVVMFESDGPGEDDAVRDLTELIMKTMDVDANSAISLSKFQQAVKRDSLCLDILGKVLPSSADSQRFMDKLSNISTFAVRRLFQFERYHSLGDTKRTTQNFCPILLDLF